jgi:hypothetical protein
MQDKILESFLERQQQEGLELARSSDLVDLFPLDGPPAQHYRLSFRCQGLVRSADGAVETADRFEIGVHFPSDYLRRADTFHVLTWFGPRNVFHPNISGGKPFICIGRLTPGTSLVDIIYQCFEIITCNKVTMRDDDALNHEACAWARRNQHLFPIDKRPLKRRTLEVEVGQP